MENLQEKLLGALIGLARATDGSEHLINPSATAVIIESLAATDADDATVERLLDRVVEEKRKMVPNCFLCANPCGRTSDFDLKELQKADPEVRRLKNHILTNLRSIAASSADCDDQVFYKGLIVVGMEDYGVSDLVPIIQELDDLLHR